jgi:pyruvate, orthophosphate dikinase
MKSSMHLPKHLFLVSRNHAGNHPHANRDTMGGKAFNLLRMAQLDLPVPPALVIGTHYTQNPEGCLLPLNTVGLPELEHVSGKRLGDARNPLILSVRSGAPVSMPGMMETLLNIGLCDKTLPGLLRQTGNPRLVWDAYRRLVASYGEVVDELPADIFENALRQMTRDRDERELDFSDLRELTRQFLALYAEHAHRPFPQDTNEQLTRAIRAVFASWHAPKAKEYRKINHLDCTMGTAVTLQAMVFGNSGNHSGAGVGFTRDPRNGERGLWVDFLANAQGEDVVSGRRNAHGHESMSQLVPSAWQALQDAARVLEREFKDMQDFEFTVEHGNLYMLQTRSGKRTPLAAARIALDLFDDGLIDASTASERVRDLRENDLGTWQVSTADGGDAQALANALSACSGVATGAIALDKEQARALTARHVPVLLLRKEAETSDIDALEMAQGLLTQTGARTSHAAVVARQLGKVCLVACQGLQIDLAARCVTIGGTSFSEGDHLTLDGNHGLVYAGELTTVLQLDEALIERRRQLLKPHTSSTEQTGQKAPTP